MSTLTFVGVKVRVPSFGDRAILNRSADGTKCLKADAAIIVNQLYLHAVDLRSQMFTSRNFYLEEFLD